MKALQKAAQSNPELAADLESLRKAYAQQLRELAARYQIELPPEDLSDEQLDAAGGTLW